MHSIAANEVHLYQLDLEDSDSPFAGLQDQLLSANEKEKANKFVQEIHRVRYQRGRSWMRTILANYVDASASELEIQEQARGKPFLENYPIEFNLSHSEMDTSRCRRDLLIVAILFDFVANCRTFYRR